MERKKVGDKLNMGKSFKGSKTKLSKRNPQMVATPKQNLNQNIGKERLINHFPTTTMDDSSALDCPQGIEPLHGDAQSNNGAEGADFLSINNRVSINLDFKSKKELSGLKDKLHSELIMVRDLMKRIEHYSPTKLQVDNGVDGGRLKRVHSRVGFADGSKSRLLDLPEGKNRGVATGEVGKAMRKPMIAQFQKNSDVTLGGQKVPLSIQTKELRANSKESREESTPVFGMENSSSKIFKICSSLLSKLMKSKGGWWFNKPVDVEGLGLVDYFTIIKRPMDLGTVKTRLTTNGYRTPKEFAEDVRLTFHNAMTYNMEGHEVHTLAEQFLKMFEDKWMAVETDYLCQSSIAADSKSDLPTPVLTSAPARPLTTTPLPPPFTSVLLSPPTDPVMTVDRSESGTNAAVPEAKSVVASGKARLPKPKARDPHKRDMTLEEKEKLSASLQDLPSEKLEGVLRIIKKRNPSLCQNDDEIEVDIDAVDTETLWELDRFVIYYKKALSKVKRSAELAKIGVVVKPIGEENGAYCGVNEAKECEADEKNIFSLSSNEGEQEGGNANISDGSSSSNSDSGSSSSDSDTDSSSS